MKHGLRDPISALTHLAGALLSVAGLAVLIVEAAKQATARHTVSFAIYGASLILLYTASTLYHSFPAPRTGVGVLRRLDHMMIYVLIAGTYTPLCLIALAGAWRWAVLIGIWVLAGAGILLTAWWFEAPRWLSTSLYVVMGWLALIALGPLLQALPPAAFIWLLGGGVFYTLGALIYGAKRPNLSRSFGFHEIFHLFVLAGSLSHFWLMFRFLMRL
ncbi:MAG: hemolysin III family protein [Bacillota bacterium]|nr:hemolysin III family protein [Bacillota bacterium]